ncbi:unnamed protein product [Adineta steineri]|uniref:PLAT domain-containing protein n=1 Tax=Adineta steineri TaxID=433720 RepID=A0A814AM45_9BILA|nr:unnamed protein product [Adineta steineri]
MATLKKRILQNISQTETIADQSQEPPPATTTTATLILDSKNQSISPFTSKVRLVELPTSSYPRLTEFVKRLKTLKTLREYNEILVEFVDRLILFQNYIDDCITILVQHILNATDPLIQIAFINTLITVEQQYPKSSVTHTNQLLELGEQTKSIKVASALLSYFSILPASLFLDKNAFVRFAIQYSSNIHVRVQLCAFKLLGTLARATDLELTLKSSIVNKLLQAIDHDDARVRAESLRTIVDLFKCKIGLDSNHYSSFVECLQDYYAEVRLAACEALFLLAINAPDSIVPSGISNDESSKLINEIFRLICDLTNDEAKIVRVQAMKMIGQLCRNGVDINLVHQTLDKKLLRITKKKAFIAKVEQLDSEMDDITVHDVTVDAQSASITAIGPYGALISGLEDEYSDVRAAAIDSCYDISCCHDVFQSKLVEYIVSMFDDDIEHVRLQAMRVLGKIAQGRVLREIAYKISIQTDSYQKDIMEDNASFYMIIHGENNQTQKLYLKDGLTSNKKVLFAKDEKTEFEFQTIDVGKIIKIIIGRDDSQTKDTWHVDNITIKQNDEIITFNAEQTIEPNSQIELYPSIIPKKTEITYKIILKTGPYQEEGNDSNIYLTIFGQNGQTKKIPLNKTTKINKKMIFKKDDTIEFEFKTNDVGKISKVILSQNLNEHGIRWHIDNLTIKQNNETTTFNVKRKIEKYTEIVLVPSSLRKKSETSQKLIKTSDSVSKVVVKIKGK